MHKMETRFLTSELVNLYDRCRPRLHAGKYEIKVSQHVRYKSTEDISADAIQTFYVKGSRFVLDQKELHMHPPNNSKGKFENILPHLTIARPGILWERELNLTNDEGDKLPWLALLVLRESEWAGDGKPLKGTVSQFKYNTDGSLFVPHLENVLPEEEDTLCQYIEIPIQQFKDFMPKIGYRGLRYFTGARTNPKDEKQGISVITAHRFPVVDKDKKDGNQFRVYLISLEGLEPCLEGKEKSEINRVRMLCLYHWSFTSYRQDGESFRELLIRLIEKTKTENTERSDTWLRYPQIELLFERDSYAKGRLMDGYIPLVYHTKTGEETLAWYRGPFIPVSNPPKVPDNIKSYTPSEAMVYDSEHGIFDLSYAVALELGRLTALSDAQFAVNLMKWRKNLSLAYSKHYLSKENDEDIWKKFEEVFESSWAANVQKALNFKSDQTIMTEHRKAWRRERRKTRNNPIDEIKRAMEHDKLSIFSHPKLVDEEKIVKDWLDNIVKYMDIPIPNMLPLDKMLPTESIKIFQIDLNWITFFMEGATSIGVQTDFDVFVNELIRDRVIFGTEHHFGMLLKSALVSGWPALQIKGDNDSGDAGAEYPMRIQEQVMLTLFRDVPKRLTITEPHEGLSYGCNDDGTITARYIDPGRMGDIVKDHGDNVTVSMKNCIDANGIINTEESMELLIKNIPGAANDDSWLPTHFTIQLLNGADQGIFNIQS